MEPLKMDINWLNIILGLVGGGFGVKIFEYIYKEFSSSRDKKKAAKTIIDRHMDPILKSADELVGKIRSLAQSDFTELNKLSMPDKEDFNTWVPYLNIIYLFSQFWARIQILRIESVFIDFASNENGKKLQQFIMALESTQTRLFERAWQRGMGEAIIAIDGKDLRVYTFKEFVDIFLSTEELERWFNPLTSIILNHKLKNNRQKILLYGSILHSLVDTLDPKHLVTKRRPSWPNKLSSKSERNLKHRVFKNYLAFVENPEVYFKKNKPLVEHGLSKESER